MHEDEETLVVASAAEPRPPPERTIGRYVVVSRVGAGGMGEVFKAYDPMLGRLVAIKRVFSAKAPEVETQRLRREAQAIAQLSHPNVIAVYDVGTSDELFMAMEYVEGNSLQKWLEVKRQPLDQILGVFLQAARGLAAAHDAGLVHRDFKPSNVLVGDDGRVRVLDFGLARRPELDEEPGGEDDSGHSPRLLDQELTKPGTLAGTPRYMAPEQFLAREVDGRTDQFGFCAALYEALTDRRPFDGEQGLVALAENVVKGRLIPIPSELSLPSWLVALVHRGLSRKPEERAASMHEVIAELERDRVRLRRASKDGSSTDDLVAAFPPPSDPDTRERVTQLRERLKKAADLKKKGDFAGALAVAAEVAAQGSDVDYAPLHAAALYTLGNLQHRTGDSASAKATLYRSAELAARAGDDWQIANVWVFLVGVIGQGLRRFQEAEAIAQVAEVAITRLGDNSSLRSRLFNSRGRNLQLEGRAAEALREHELALALDVDTHGADHPLVVITLAHLAEALLELGRTDRALSHLERALDICKKQKKRGPSYATCLLLYGRALLRRGDVEAAERALEEAREKFARYPDRNADLMEVHAELVRCRGARTERSAS